MTLLVVKWAGVTCLGLMAAFVAVVYITRDHVDFLDKVLAFALQAGKYLAAAGVGAVGGGAVVDRRHRRRTAQVANVRE